MASISPRIPAHLSARNAVGQESAAAQPEAGPSIGPLIPPQIPSATITPPGLPVPRYEEEEEEEDEDEDGGDYAPELPPDLAAARANASGPPPPRRTFGPALGPFRREEEEESEEEDEIGPAPPPPPRHSAGTGPLDAREEAVTEFMEKEAQRRKAIEVRLSPSGSCTCSSACMSCAPVSVLISASAPQEAARPKALQREEWMLVPPSSSDLLSSAPLPLLFSPCHLVA